MIILSKSNEGYWVDRNVLYEEIIGFLWDSGISAFEPLMMHKGIYKKDNFYYYFMFRDRERLAPLREIKTWVDVKT